MVFNTSLQQQDQEGQSDSALWSEEKYFSCSAFHPFSKKTLSFAKLNSFSYLFLFLFLQEII